jgi:hypothetical protein
LVAAVFCPERAARAQEKPESLIQQGVELRRQGNDALAEGYFKRAYTIAHTPRSAAQLGLVEQALGHFLDAEQHLSEALGHGDTWVDENRSDLEASRVFVRERLARVQVRGLPPGTTVQLGARAPLPVGSDGVVWAPPGAVSLTFAAPGRSPVLEALVATAGLSVELRVELPEATTAAPPASAAAPPGSAAAPPVPAVVATTPLGQPAQADLQAHDDGGRSTRIAGAVVAGAGAALAVAGVVTYALGSSKVGAINSDAASGHPYNTANGNYATLGDAGIGLMIAGGAAVVTGGLLYVLNRAPANEPGEARVSFGYLPGGGGQLLIGGRF